MIDSDKFIHWLQGINKRRVLADLRAGLRLETMERAWPHIAKVCDLTNNREELVTRIVAGLFALHPDHSPNVRGFGSSIQILAYRRDDPELKVHKKYLMRLVECSTVQDLLERLPFMVRMMKSEGVKINYEQLYLDLFFWGIGPTPDRSKRQWCRDYFYKKGDSDVSNEDTNREA